MAGDDLFDLALIDLETIGTCAQQGCFYDLNRIEYIDFSQPRWNPEVNDTVSIGGRVFYTSSDFSLRDKSRACILTYNPKIVSDYDMPDLLGLVRDGTWTIERMTECVRMVSGDIDGDGKMTEKDACGLPMDSYNAFAAFIYGCDNHIRSSRSRSTMKVRKNTRRWRMSTGCCSASPQAPQRRNFPALCWKRSPRRPPTPR